MRVKVRLFAALAVYAPGGEAGAGFETDLPAGSDLADLTAALNLPRADARLAFVNGRAETFDYDLHEDDEVAIFPPVGGG